MEEQPAGHSIDESLLLRYFAQGVNARERNEVEAWMKADAEHLKLAREVYYLKLATDTYHTLRTTSAQEPLREVKRRINKRRPVSWIQWFQRVAAVLLIPLLAVCSYLLIRESSGERFMEMRMNPGMIGSVLLPDGTKVWLNSNSYLKYPTRFDSGTREVSLDGEAYFAVAKDEKHRFIVHTNQEQVRLEVLGTEFNVDAYDNNGFVATTLVSGSVRLDYKASDHQVNSLMMTPEDKVVYNREDGSVSQNKVYVREDIVWKEGVVVLRNTPLKDVLWTLSKRFNVNFEVRNKALESSSFTGVFTDQQLEQILEHFKIASHVRYSISQDVSPTGELQRKRVILY